MSAARRTMLADRKALLVARAELDRARVMLAFHEIKTVVAPGSPTDRTTRYRSAAALLIGVLRPAIGNSRFARVTRVAWIALAALRIARSWKQ